MARPAANRQRIIDHGEVFTPPSLVNDMLDLVSQECERIDSRFLEPACGNGNFLVEVLRRKLKTVTQKHARNREKWGRDAILALSSLYGIDLLPDNINECHRRLLHILKEMHVACFKDSLPEGTVKAATYILTKNIVQGDALTLRTAADFPIIFPEWSPINGAMLKRRDFKFDHLLQTGHYTSQIKSQTHRTLFSDLGEEVFAPIPVGDYPPCHYLKIPEMETLHEGP